MQLSVIGKLLMTVAVAVVTSAAPPRVSIVGGGPAGALAAIYLGRSGYAVDLFEARLRATLAAPNPRSYNTVIFPKGLDALAAAGIDLYAPEHEDIAVVVKGGVSHTVDGLVKESGSFANGFISIDRGDLAQRLLDIACTLSTVSVHYSCSLAGVDLQRKCLQLRRDGHAHLAEQEYDMLIGADGVNSRVREALEKQADKFGVRQNLEGSAFKTVDLGPVDQLKGYSPDSHWEQRFHSWRGKVANGRMICPPGVTKRVRGVLILPRTGRYTFETLAGTPEQARQYFRSEFPSAFSAQNGPSEEQCAAFCAASAGSLKSTYCDRLADGHVALVGDAAHSMVASVGQGVNAAMQSVQCLAAALGCASATSAAPVQVDAIPALLQQYSKERIADVHAVVRLSEVGFGQTALQRTFFRAQAICTLLLLKLRLSPPPAFFKIGSSELSYSAIQRAINREKRVTLALLTTVTAVAAAAVMKRTAAPVTFFLGGLLSFSLVARLAQGVQQRYAATRPTG